MIDFNGRLSYRILDLQGWHNRANITRNVAIMNDLSSQKCNIFSLGFHLFDLWNQCQYRGCDFFTYCEHYFNLGKSQVSRYINVVVEFGELVNGKYYDPLVGFKEEYKDFSISCLFEMLPLTEEQRKEIKSDWTIKQIREYKKSLVATSQQSEPEVEKEAKPKDPKYERFAKYSKNDCIDRILDLEDENGKLRAQLLLYSDQSNRVSELEAQLATADFKIVKKLAVCK